MARHRRKVVRGSGRAVTAILWLQRALTLTLSPYDISRMAESYARSQAVVMVSRRDLRHFVGARPWLVRLAAWRHPVLRRLKGRGAAR